MNQLAASGGNGIGRSIPPIHSALDSLLLAASLIIPTPTFAAPATDVRDGASADRDGR